MSIKRVDAFLSSLGYCTRGEAKSFVKNHMVMVDGIRIFDTSLKVKHSSISVDNEPLDPLNITILMNKPKGFVCSHGDSGRLIYELLPLRWQRRNPKISTIGRLDADTSGAILLSDDGDLNHRLSSPKNHISKIYLVELRDDLRGDEADIFASGMMLYGESKPLLGANLEVISKKLVRLEIFEGRYHQVKRMFKALGNEVISLHRESFGDCRVDTLESGKYYVRLLS